MLAVSGGYALPRGKGVRRVGAPVRLRADRFVGWRTARKRVAVSILGTAATTYGRATAGGCAAIVLPGESTPRLSGTLLPLARHLQRRRNVLSSRGMLRTCQGTIARRPDAPSCPPGRLVAQLLGLDAP